MLQDASILAIVEIVLFGPSLILSLVTTFKHGFGRQAGWIYLALFSLNRVIGASCQLATETHPTNRSLYEAAITCAGIGLSFLLFATLGLLSRLHDGSSSFAIPTRVFRLLHLPIIVGLILGIVGGTDLYSQSSSDSNQGRDLLKASVILFLVAWVVLAIITIVTLARTRLADASERHLLFAVVVAMPFLFVRIVYSILADYDTSTQTFSQLDGNITVRAFMATLEEFAVVLLYLIAGFLTPVISRAAVQGAGSFYDSNTTQGPGRNGAGGAYNGGNERGRFAAGGAAAGGFLMRRWERRTARFTGQRYGDGYANGYGRNGAAFKEGHQAGVTDAV
ncbi:MAG: hypothetical protein M1838_006276 [Thelocarpon superellum]|nr:MAG: hypothetical protein M1838_006276 [Thelocarpon superellum]